MPGQSSSFIPKKKQTSSAKTSSSKAAFASEAGIFLITAAIIFLLVIAAWIGIELYKRYIDQQTAAKKDQFEAAKKTLEHEGLDQIVRVDTRLDAAADVIDDHVAPTHIFEKLEEYTVDGLRYSSFAMEGTPKTSMKLTLSGEAHNYSTVISQERHFQRTSFITDAIFSNIKENGDTGNITFTLNLEVPADRLRYDDVVEPALPNQVGVPQDGGGTTTPRNEQATSSASQGAEGDSEEASNSLIPSL